MKVTRFRILLSMVAVLIAALALRGTARAQSWCVQPVDAPEWGCLEIHISPSGIAGDFYVDTYPVTYYSYIGNAVVLPGRRHILVNNITSSEPGWNKFFVYPSEASTFATVNQGSLTTATVSFRRIYINGALQVTCDIWNVSEGDDLACLVSIDGIPQADLIAPRAKATYYINPGSHHVTTQIVGGSTYFWTPASRDVNVSIYLGKTTFLAPRFIKLGHLTATLTEPNTYSDYYVDGVLIANQATAIDTWVMPNQYHKLEIKNIQDYTANGLYYWQNYTIWIYVGSGGTRTVNAIPAKVWNMGFLQVTCNITNYNPSLFMNCMPTLDGIPQEPIPHGSTVTYTVGRGTHQVVVTVGPPELWVNEPRTYNANVYGGRTSTLLLSVPAVAP